jgi:hypothetical protein
MSETTQDYLRLVAELLSLRGNAQSSDDIEAEYADRFEQLWRTMTPQEQEDAERAIATMCAQES